MSDEMTEEEFEKLTPFEKELNNLLERIIEYLGCIDESIRDLRDYD